nr:L-glutamate gamma-semialdehyde dehydrogenase [Planctomycetota bacterium]
ALDARFNPADPEGTFDRVAGRLRPILREARDRHAFVNVDMEQFAYKPLTLEIFRRVFLEEEFRDFKDVGIVVQAYLRDSGDDLASLLDWVDERETPVWVRLVKGAYWDYETVVAQANGWPIPVYRQKWQSDENFERLTTVLMENHHKLRPAIASHNLRSLSHAIAAAKQFNLRRDAFELQMLYGMAGDQAELFSEQGYRVRIYTPFGELIPGMAYLVRRLLENTSNDSFLRHSFDASASIEELLMSPAKVGAKTPPLPPDPQPEFANEPPTDFSREENRESMREALEDVRSQFGRDYPLVIGGRATDTTKKITSVNPSNPSEIVGVVATATPEQASDAIEAARRAFPQWMRTDPGHRAEYLELAAAEMRVRRFELAAWIVFECGKPWRDADADVAEAIDFCTYYALRMRQLAEGREVRIAGEENTYFYRPRGVAVVIAPWNFPLAILTGMTAAALVTGNTVVMKPAEQSPVIAAKLMEVFRDAGLPEGVVNYLPGVGEEIGPELVGSPLVDLIAFTGSREVGLGINAKAADTDPRQTSVKHVVAEMGGKNAIIVDDDADLDEAVAGVVQSAFGYSGQKCSACSRVIVLDAAYDVFVERLIEATKSLKIGPAEDPGTDVGPLIDDEARKRVKKYVALGSEVHTLALGIEPGSSAKKGFFVGPHIFTNVKPEDRLATEEIFGPVLAVFRAKEFDEALRLANGTSYALTAGVFSRSPENLRKARRELIAGNVYLNRGITGAMVHRQPFGGFKMSGIGAKAGGPDYLLQFLIPVNVTENTMRRGFAPAADPTTTAGE